MRQAMSPWRPAARNDGVDGDAERRARGWEQGPRKEAGVRSRNMRVEGGGVEQGARTEREE